jgi:circadian clock protein KaiC
MIIERCPTGIAGFDKLCQGGFVRNSDNLVIGGPGSGKTTFMLQFLYNGATQFDENGLYCSFEPDIVDIIQDGFSFGWDFARLNEMDKVKFLKFSPQTSIRDLKGEITRLVSKYSIRRICIDPLAVLSLNINDEARIREQIYELTSLMKRLRVTTILADEIIEDTSNKNGMMRTEIVKFLADSVTMLFPTGVGSADRSLKIVKMRRTNHVRGQVGMIINETGVNIILDRF